MRLIAVQRILGALLMAFSLFMLVPLGISYLYGATSFSDLLSTSFLLTGDGAARPFLFAFSTILGWSYYGEKSAEYLFGEGVIIPYRVAFVAVVMIGSMLKLDIVWTLADVMNGLMALPNLIGLLLLSGVVARESRKLLEEEHLLK